MRRRFVVLAVIAAVLALASGIVLAQASPTPPYASNADCLYCHDVAGTGPAMTKVDFAAPAAVDYGRCNKCHSSGPHHRETGECNDCHLTWPDRGPDYDFSEITPYGFFDNPGSLSTDANTLHDIHVNGSWLKGLNPGSDCDNCHGNAKCQACHGVWSGAHDGHTYDSASGTYAYPPVTYDVANGRTVKTLPITCVNDACHSLSDAGTVAFAEPACADCHATKTDAHGYDGADHVADVGAVVDGGGKTCGSCHDMDLLAAHDAPGSSASGGDCGTCHPTPRDSFGVWDDTCSTGGCHATGSATEPHAGEGTAHAPSFAGDSAICEDCHAATDLTVVHTTAVLGSDPLRTSCNVCHAPAEYPTTGDCATCHGVFDAHTYDIVAHTSTWTLDGCIGAGCHGSNELWTEHTRANPAFECATCHDNASDPAYAAAIAAGDTACNACHTGASETSGHRDQHPAVPPLADGTGPHYAYYTGTASGTPTSDCTLCHTSNLIDEHLGDLTREPRTDAAGDPLSCDSCHESADTDVVFAIATSMTNCDSCHDIHGPMGAVHTSTYVDAPEVPCGECHSADLTLEHEGLEAEPNGRTLTGCELCHAYTEGVRGAEIQTAIEITNDTRCSACHGDYHAGLTASHSADDTASVDACGPCHDPSDTGMDVTALHTGVASPGACGVCHDNPARVPDITAVTAACANCHAAEGTDYHRGMDVHVSADEALCSNQCHHRNPDVTAVHDECTTCHTVVDTANLDTACTTCHLVQGTDFHTRIEPQHIRPADADTEYCIRCHTEQTDVRVIHAADPADSCTTCHTTNCSDCHLTHGQPHNEWYGFLNLTTKCQNCHFVEGTEYHLVSNAAHTYADGVSCVGSGCHASQSLPEAHEPYMSRYPAYEDTCALCHLNPAVDISASTADCSSCHTVHGDIGAIHTPTASQECVDCHETADVRDLHGADPASSCAVCHNATVTLPATTDCVGCHAALSPPDPSHYLGTEATHTAAAPDGSCVGCHYLEMDPEHAKASSGPVSCVTCHETEVDAFTGPWDETCDACHATKHTDSHTAHASPSTECGGSGCHVIQDVTMIHAFLPAVGCPSCHEDQDTLPTTTVCTDCHAPEHAGEDVAHTTTASAECVACHETTDVRELHGADVAASCAFCHDGGPLPTTTECVECHAELSPPDPSHYLPGPHEALEDAGCADCHYMDMDSEHDKASSGPVDCVTCHEGEVDTFTGPWDASCMACHTVRHADQDASHVSSRADCTRCHEPGAADVSVIHIDVEGPGEGCSVCHGVDFTATSTDCSTSGCHATYHPAAAGAHQHTGVYCDGAGCHASNSLPEAHDPYMGDYPQYEDSCALCHLNDDPGRIDWNTASGNCFSCHPTIHPNLVADHTAPNSQECVDCHETDSVRDIHAPNASSWSSCRRCHDGSALPADTQCTNCHGVAPVDTEHYFPYDHTSGGRPWDLIDETCDDCHSLELMVEHDKPSSGPVECVTCHETRVDVFNQYGIWDYSCVMCHADKHVDEDAAHVSDTAACGGSACHDLGDVRVVHESDDYVEYPAPRTFRDAFETGDFRHWDQVDPSWTMSNARNDSSLGGIYTVRGGGGSTDQSLLKYVDLAGMSSISLRYDIKWYSTSPASVLEVQYFDGGWNTLTAFDLSSDQYWVTRTSSGIPDTATAIRFWWNGGGGYVLLDKVVLSGTDPGAQIVSGNGCDNCHDATSIPESTSCWTYGCHDSGVHTQVPQHKATAPASLACGVCHESGETEIDVTHYGLHGDQGWPAACNVCHDNPARVPDLSAETAECSSCHTVDEVDYHRNMAVHESADAASCSGQCHHAGSDVRYSHPECTTCHTVLDTANLDTACTTCHLVQGDDYHSQITTQHVRPEDALTAFCTRCHGDTTDVRLVHGTDPAASCATCHTSDCDDCHDSGQEMYGTVKPVRTTLCQNCHYQNSPEYHSGNDSRHTYSGAPSTCGQSYCHASLSLADAHDPYLGEYPQYEDACALCHLNDDVGRIDWNAATADCATCHTVHPDEEPVHFAPGSQECVDCHEEDDVRVLHQTNASSLSSCARCHDNPALPVLPQDAACTNCHDYSPADPDHYTAAGHTASFTGQDGCDDCHYLEMKPEHFKASSGSVSCVSCHELKVDDFVNSWDQTCLACHATNHGDVDGAHASTRTDCAGSGCHDVSDVRLVHERDDYVAITPTGFEYVEVFSEGFETGDVTGWDDAGTWQAFNYSIGTGNYVGGTNGSAFNPPPATYLVKNVDLTGLYDVELTFGYRWQYCESDDTFEVQYFDGTWNTLWSPNIDYNIWWETSTAFSLPSNATAIRFCFEANSGDWVYIDDVLVRGKRDGMTNPSGNGCDRCHGQDTIPASTDCESSGCHGSFHGGADGSHAATATASVDGCGRCHDNVVGGAIDVPTVHVAAAEGECAVCHANSTRVPDISLETAECASCHAIDGTEYHRDASSAHYYADGASCVGAGCHASQSLPEAHEPYMSRYPTYEDTCALCHLNDDPGRIDWNTASADCASCHTVHGDIGVIHTTAASQECVDCHETADVRDLHGADPASSCAVCHNATVTLPATTECVGCNAALSPPDPSHYEAAPHTASVQGGCSNCHYVEMGPEHAKASSGPVSCVTCHETEVDSFTAPWDDTCDPCHVQRHGDQGQNHQSNRGECGGSGCHDVGNVGSVHAGRPGGGCDLCHAADAIPATTDCLTCHPGATPGHHESHDASGFIIDGCDGCHLTYLDDEHLELGYACAVCHDSTNQAVVGAISTGARGCVSCHPDNHYDGNGRYYEFNPNNSSGHRTTPDLPGMRSSFEVDGNTYSWPLPNASTFLKTGYDYDTIVTCDDCHSFGNDPAGPHGAAVQIEIDPDYPVSFSDGMLTDNNSIGMQTGLLCAKCHDLTGTGSYSSGWSNDAHKEHDDRGFYGGSRCVSCHISVPHGWARPRMLGSTTDPAPYTVAANGLDRIRLTSYNPSDWDKRDCEAGCDDHHDEPISNPWPGTVAPPPDAGSIAGRVIDEQGAGLSGVTVSAGGVSSQTGSDGYYALTGVPVGAHTVTASKSGYLSAQQNVTVLKDQTTTVDFTLIEAPVTTGSVSGVVSSASGGPVAGAGVSISGGPSTTTAADGSYALVDVEAGTYTVDVSASGYTPWSGSVTVLAGQTTTQDVTLQPTTGQVIFYDSFETGDFRYWDDFSYWTFSTKNHTGSRSAVMRRYRRYIYLGAEIDTRDYDEITIEFWVKGSQYTESADYIKVEFRDDHGDWNTVYYKTLEDRVTQWRKHTIVIDEHDVGSFGRNTEFRIGARVSANNEYQYVDDVEVTAR